MTPSKMNELKLLGNFYRSVDQTQLNESSDSTVQKCWYLENQNSWFDNYTHWEIVKVHSNLESFISKFCLDILNSNKNG